MDIGLLRLCLSMYPKAVFYLFVLKERERDQHIIHGMNREDCQRMMQTSCLYEGNQIQESKLLQVEEKVLSGLQRLKKYSMIMFCE